nr:glycosyltransferase [Helleborus thibetanus]
MSHTTQAPPHMIMHPSPGMGHLIPLTEFAKRLVTLHDFTVTVVVPTDNKTSTEAMKKFLTALPKGIDHIFLDPVNFDDLPKNIREETMLSLLMDRSLPSLREAFEKITSANRVVALVVDMFGTGTYELSREFKVPPYMFFPSTSMVLTLILHMEELHEKYGQTEFRDIPEPIALPGCVPFKGVDIFNPAMDKTSDAYTWIVEASKFYSSADGILLNTYDSLESETLQALKSRGKPPIYPIGPLVQLETKWAADDSGCVDFLNAQPPNSVLFISFGSVGVLTHNQIIELAQGLELSGTRFIWVLRVPSDVPNAKDPLEYLPNGFLERTKGVGLVVPSWAPQVQILGHGSTGGFVTHCGWNSTLEGVMNGLPLIGWPLYAEQKLNAVMISERLKIALRVKANENGIVDREEVARVIKALMKGEEGKRIKDKVNELRTAGTQLLNEDGTSTKALSEVANMWKNYKSV